MTTRAERVPTFVLTAGLVVITVCFLTLAFKHLSYPLIWHDEADTTMFAVRILEYGYPKVHGERNIVYGLQQGLEAGVKEETDAYIGSPWFQYYFATLGVVLASGVEDLWAKTAFLRLPFALIGVLGLAILLFAVLPAVGDERRSRLVFAFFYVVLLSYSILLILHVREVRYYSLVVFLASCSLYVFFRHHVFRSLGFGVYAATLALSLTLLMNTFYAAYGIFAVAMGLHHCARAWALPGRPAERLRWLFRTSLPLVVSAALAVPFVLFFEIFEITGAIFERFGTSWRSYGTNLWNVIETLLRFEFLLPAVLVKLTAFFFLRGAAGPPRIARERLAISNFLWLLIVTYVLMIARTPFIFERYFIVLSPLLTLAFLLDGTTCVEAVRQRSWTALRAGARTAVVLTLVLSPGTFWIRFPEFRGRIHEILHPYMGPLDFVIPYIQEKYPNPERLVIATNYEGPSYMYYLGSHATVGYFQPDLERDLQFQPDIIVIRSWRTGTKVLLELMNQGDYAVHVFPVLPDWVNNIPGLVPVMRDLSHRFETRLAEDPRMALRILERRREGAASRRQAEEVGRP